MGEGQPRRCGSDYRHQSELRHSGSKLNSDIIATWGDDSSFVGSVSSTKSRAGSVMTPVNTSAPC